jgi:formylglycine-generating enzyme required for sulfatase activity
MGEPAPGNAECGPLCPTALVSWDRVQEFLAELNSAHPGRNYRLPTEAEWEYAARAGVTGDDWDLSGLETVAWWSENSGGGPHPVGRKAPNLWGLHDVLGNLWEFASDFYSSAYYSQSPVENPLGPANGWASDGRRVVRGGSYTSPVGHMGFWVRGQVYPFILGREIGFRIAADDWTGS